MDPTRSLFSVPERSLEDCKTDGSFKIFFFKNNFLCQMSVNLLQDTDKLRYFAITEFKNCFSIRSPSLLFNESNHGLEVICHFHAIAIARRRKVWFHLRMSGISVAKKNV